MFFVFRSCFEAPESPGCHGSVAFAEQSSALKPDAIGGESGFVSAMRWGHQKQCDDLAGQCALAGFFQHRALLPDSSGKLAACGTRAAAVGAQPLGGAGKMRQAFDFARLPLFQPRLETALEPRHIERIQLPALHQAQQSRGLAPDKAAQRRCVLRFGAVLAQVDRLGGTDLGQVSRGPVGPAPCALGKAMVDLRKRHNGCRHSHVCKPLIQVCFIKVESKSRIKAAHLGQKVAPHRHVGAFGLDGPVGLGMQNAGLVAFDVQL